MNMEKSENTGKIVSALLMGATIGGIIGVGLGLLFAPEKGSDLRKKLSTSGDDLTGVLGNKFKTFLDEIKNEAGSANSALSEVVENGLAKIKS
jgi:gas vesicle protein